MTIYNNGTNSFVWKGTRYGVATRVKFKDDFIKNFTWMGEKICDKGMFDKVYIEQGRKMFQFNKYCPEEMFMDHIYPGYFSFTELELMDAIELILKPVPIEEVTAQESSYTVRQLSDNYESKRNFFELNGRYYGQGSKIYITDGFMRYYEMKTGNNLTKKIAFLYSDVVNGVREYCIASCPDMKLEHINNYCLTYTLTEEEFFQSIEFITDCHTIKRKDKDEPVIFIFWLLYFAIIVLSFVIFVKPSAVIVAATVGFFKLRNKLLRQ